MHQKRFTSINAEPENYFCHKKQNQDTFVNNMNYVWIDFLESFITSDANHRN